MVARRTRLTLAVGLTALLLIGTAAGGAGARAGAWADSDDATESSESKYVQQSTGESNDTEEVTGQERPDDNVSRVRTVHMSPFLPNVTVEIDSDTVVRNLSFGETSNYTRVGSGNAIFEIETESGEKIFETNSTLEPNANYTVLAVATISGNDTIRFQPALLADDYELPSDDNASLRFVHASPDTSPVDVTIAETNTTVADNVTFREDGDYVEIPAENVTLEVRQETPDDAGEIIHRAQISPEAGTVNSAYLVGYQNPEEAPVDAPLDVGLFQDDGRDEVVAEDEDAEGAGEKAGTEDTEGVDEEAGNRTSGKNEIASVSFEEQETDGTRIEVTSVTLPEGGFVTIHDSSLRDGAVVDSVIGTSGYLESGQHDEVDAELYEGVPDTEFDQDRLTEDQTLIAMAHRDTDGDEEYDFVETEGDDDGPYTEDGDAVTDDAEMTVEEEDDES